MNRRICDLSAAEMAEIVALYRDGEPIVQIAAAYGVSDKTVSVVAHKGGAQPRQLRGARALEFASFDPGKLEIENIDDEPRVRDLVLGSALGYDRPRKIRDLISKHNNDLQYIARLPQRRATSHDGSGARVIHESLLNQAQVSYIITRCGLPNANEWCKQIAMVFAAWQTGKLDDLQTVVEIQDAREAAEIAAPALAELNRAMVASVVREENAPLVAKVDAVYQLVWAQSKRRDCTAETKRQHVGTISQHYGGRCPCCSDRSVVSSGGDILGHFDHWTDNPGKNGAHETWLVCAECNQGFQSRRIDRADYRIFFDGFQKRRKQWLEAIQPSLI